MKKVIFLTLVLSFVFVSVNTVLAIPPNLNYRCENSESIQLSDSSEKYIIDLSANKDIQVCEVEFISNGNVYRFTQDYQESQNGFNTSGVGMYKTVTDYQVRIWYTGNKPDSVMVYYRKDIPGESLISGPPNPSDPNGLFDPLYLPIIIR